VIHENDFASIGRPNQHCRVFVRGAAQYCGPAKASALAGQNRSEVDLEYRRPATTLFAAFERFRDAFLPSDAAQWTGHSADGRSNLPAYLDWLERAAANRDMAPGLVPMDTFWVFCETEMAGELKIRHYLRGPLLRHGGHIGYSVQPRFRNRGIATAMLRFGLDRLRSLGEVDALITCADNNAASARVIERCGGVRIPDTFFEGVRQRRYLIAL